MWMRKNQMKLLKPRPSAKGTLYSNLECASVWREGDVALRVRNRESESDATQQKHCKLVNVRWSNTHTTGWYEVDRPRKQRHCDGRQWQRSSMSNWDGMIERIADWAEDVCHLDDDAGRERKVQQSAERAYCSPNPEPRSDENVK